MLLLATSDLIAKKNSFGQDYKPINIVCNISGFHNDKDWECF